MYELIFNPGTDDVERISFAVSEADLDDAVDVGRVERTDPLDKQMRQCAYHMVLELRVCDDAERISSEPWVLVCRGKIIARNHLASAITDDDLK